MNKQFSAITFAAGCSVIVNERLARVEAIISLNGVRCVDVDNKRACAMAYAAALEIVDQTVAEVAVDFSDFIEPEAAASACGFLAKAKALIDLAMSSVEGEDSDASRELVTTAAGEFIRNAMEALEGQP